MPWTDTITSTTKIRGIHIRELLDQLNVERTKRNLSTFSLNVQDGVTKIMASHITSLRSWIDATPLTVGCSSYCSSVNGSRYSSRNVGNQSVSNSYHTVYSNYRPTSYSTVNNSNYTSVK